MMEKHQPESTPTVSRPRNFATTRWSLVLSAGEGVSPESKRALAMLCESYWYPLYAYVRRRGHQATDAQDLTQEFFAQVLEKDYLKSADPDRGRFRGFLLTAMKRFLSNQLDRQQAQKRGGASQHLSIDLEWGENRYSLEPTDQWTAEKIFERQWALTLLDQVIDRLRSEYSEAGKARLFDVLKVFLTGESGAPSYAEVAGELEMSEGAVKVAVHRLRRRYRELLRVEISQTVLGPEEVDGELKLLLAALRGQ